MSKVVFWLNSFIPKTVLNYTQTITEGQHTGKTAVPLPGVARLNPFNTFKKKDAGFLTDQRTFSSDIPVSSRMHSSLVLDLDTRTMSQDHKTSGTIEVDITTGEQIASADADMSRCSFTDLKHTSNTNYDIYSTKLKASASDPLVSGAAWIEYNGTLEIHISKARSGLMVTFAGNIDEFPAYEAYASFGGETKTLFESPPPSGNTVMHLLGPANRPIAGEALFFIPGS